MNLDEPWQQQFSTDFPECRLEEQAGMSREDLKFMKFANKVFSQQDQEPKKRPFAHFKGKSETGPPPPPPPPKKKAIPECNVVPIPY